MHCFGVTHHNPAQVLDFLRRNKLVTTRKEVMTASCGEILPRSSKRKIVFLLDTLTASRNIKTLNSEDYDGFLVFVFGSTLKLREIEGCIPLDAEDSEDPMNPVSLRKSLRIAAVRKSMRKKKPLERKRTDHLRAMVDSVKKGSLLAPLMTFIYSLPSSTHQTPVKKACADYFRSTQTIDATIRVIERAVGMPLTRLANTRLRGILESDAANRYRAFFKAYKARMTEEQVEALCTSMKVSLYEVNYLLNVSSESVKGSKKKTKARR